MKYNLTILALAFSVLSQGCGSDDTAIGVDLEPVVVPGLASSASGYFVGAALPAGDASNSVFARNDLQAVVEKNFNQITAENIMKPSYLQPIEDDFDFSDADALMDYAKLIGATVHGHTLVWHRQIPDWMRSACSSKAACEAVMESHITNVVQHFKDSYPNELISWDVVNEAFNDDGSYRNSGSEGSIWYAAIGESYIESAFKAVDKIHTSADLYYNDYNLELNGAKLDSALSLTNQLKSKAAGIDGLGFQMHISLEHPALESITGALQKAVDTG
ncbi:Endo-beta-1,4-xylanase Xyn10C [Vibrio cholerae]|nr:Endo-beta-1,4-xylanase Xyn10C [Vibrio cholerae]